MAGGKNTPKHRDDYRNTSAALRNAMAHARKPRARAGYGTPWWLGFGFLRGNGTGEGYLPRVTSAVLDRLFDLRLLSIA